MPRKPIKGGAVFRAYFKEAKRHPWLLTGILLGTIGMQVADLVSPLYLRELLNLLASHVPSPEITQQLFFIIEIIAAAALLNWLSRRIQIVCTNFFDSGIMADLQVSAFNYLLKHSYHFFISRFSGTLTRKVSKFAAAFEFMFDAVATCFFPTGLFAVGAVIILFLRNQTLGITLGIWLLCFVIFLLYVARLRLPLRAARAEADSKIVGNLSDAISNQNTVALFSGTAHEHSLFKGVVNLWRKATLRSWNTDEVIWGVLGILMAGINIGLLTGAVILWQQGLVTVGDFVLIQSYLIGLFDRLVTINRELRKFFDAHADAMEMVEILETPHEIQDAADAMPLSISRCEITFKNVSFFFNISRPVLDNLNLTIRGGEKLALVGPSGAGKSTVTKLLLRLYDASSGSISIDGKNITMVPQDNLRNAIAFVPQEPILFHRTLMENIRYGWREATEEEVIEAAKKAHCHEFISLLPDSYGTYVGERGIKLSGGERQRVAIARAILKNAPILILDEATSSLDSESESLIQDALSTLMQGKTVLVIAHRLSTIMCMDRIVVLESGKVIAEGTHRELLKEGGLYQKLWSIQAGGFRDDTAPPENETEKIIEELTEDSEGR